MYTENKTSHIVFVSHFASNMPELLLKKQTKGNQLFLNNAELNLHNFFGQLNDL